MNKTKRIFVAMAMVLITLMITMLAGCSGQGSSHVHDLTKVAPKAATCLESGNREYYVCSGCDGTFADGEGVMPLSAEKYVIPAKGHNVAKHGEKKATCSSEGTKEHYECRSCGTLFRDAEGMFQIDEPTKAPVLSHELTKVAAQAAVGFVPGWQEHYTCANCDSIYKDAFGLEETTREAIKIAPVLTDFEYKIAFTPAANIESINGTGGADYISASYTTMDGMPATQFTFKANSTAKLLQFSQRAKNLSIAADMLKDITLCLSTIVKERHFKHVLLVKKSRISVIDNGFGKLRETLLPLDIWF